MSVEAKKAKQVIIDEISEKFEKASSVVVVDYLGLTVAEADEMRSNLRKEGVGFTVYKNTLVKRAIEGTPYESLGEYLHGSSAFAFSGEDATAGARVLSKSIKQYKKMAFKGGVVEGKVFDKAQVEALADIPSREVLIARFLGSVQAPVASFARVLQAIVDKDAAPAEAAEAAEA
ncbi:MAG: 50S ribosomal protein L10 [Mogibacterium sp.]|nr:50S ribosomal protein L10 [Mogibacterium sp.]